MATDDDDPTAGEDTVVHKAALVVLLGAGLAFGFVMGVSSARVEATPRPAEVAAVTPLTPTLAAPAPVPAPATTTTVPAPATTTTPAPPAPAKPEPALPPTPEPKKAGPAPAPSTTTTEPSPEPTPEPKKVVPKKTAPKKVEPKKTATAVAVNLTYEKDVLPIFRDKCNECHGAVTTKSGLDLRTLAAVRKGGNGGPAVEPGKPDSSYLLEVIVNGTMPPPNKGKLSKAQIEKVRAWIAAGAK